MAKPVAEEGETRFLNVDLDILSKARLEPLVEAFGKRVSVHYVGREGRRFGAHLALLSYGQSADALMSALARLVKRLPPRARRLWNGAIAREFNIGIQAGLKPRSHELRIDEETLALVASLGGRIVVTTYAPDDSVLSTWAAQGSVPPNQASCILPYARRRSRKR